LQFNICTFVFEDYLLQTTSTTFVTLPQSLTEDMSISLQESTITLSSSFSVSSKAKVATGCCVPTFRVVGSHLF